MKVCLLFFTFQRPFLMRNRTTTEFLTKSENLFFEFEIYKFLKSKIQREIINFHRDRNFTLRNRSKIRCLNFNLKKQRRSASDSEVWETATKAGPSKLQIRRLNKSTIFLFTCEPDSFLTANWQI